MKHNAEEAEADVGAVPALDLLSGETLPGRITIPGRGVRILERIEA